MRDDEHASAGLAPVVPRPAPKAGPGDHGDEAPRTERAPSARMVAADASKAAALAPAGDDEADDEAETRVSAALAAARPGPPIVSLADDEEAPASELEDPTRMREWGSRPSMPSFPGDLLAAAESERILVVSPPRTSSPDLGSSPDLVTAELGEASPADPSKQYVKVPVTVLVPVALLLLVSVALVTYLLGAPARRMAREAAAHSAAEAQSSTTPAAPAATTSASAAPSSPAPSVSPAKATASTKASASPAARVDASGAVARAPFDVDATRKKLERAALAVCRVEGGLTGRGTSLVRFSPEGRVVDVTVGPPYEGTPQGDCIARELERVVVAPFEGPAQSIEHDYALAAE